jgi:hypothetical protein
MKVEQAVMTQDPDNVSNWTISSRVKLLCEVIEDVPPYQKRVRILEAGAGLNVDDIIVAPSAKITEN